MLNFEKPCLFVPVLLQTLESYLDKSFYKTASLIAASCRSAAVFRCAVRSILLDASRRMKFLLFRTHAHTWMHVHTFVHTCVHVGTHLLSFCLFA